MINKNGLLFFIFIITTAYACNVFAQPTLFVKNGKEDYSLGRYISILEDKGGHLTIDEATSDSMKDKYVYYGKETINFKFTSSAYWVRFVFKDTLSDPASGLIDPQNIRNWILVNNEPVIEDIRVFYKSQNQSKNTYVEQKAGSIVPVNKRKIGTNDFIASLPALTDKSDTVYIRLKTNSQFIISLNMMTAEEYILHSTNKYFFHGILFGILVMLIVYNILLYFSIKEKTYIYYVLYILCYMLFIFVYHGYYFKIISRTFYHDYYILPLSILSIGGVFWLLLTREFLSTRFCLPWAFKLLTYSTPLAPILCILVFVISPSLAAVWSISILGYYVLGFVIALITLKKGIEVSKYYLLALLGMALGILITSFTRNNFLQLTYNFWTQNAVNLGILWEALVLAATVGYRFNYLKAEKEKEKALMRSQIAADLHDEVGSNLSTISLQSSLMMRDKQLNYNSKEQLQNISNLAGTTTDIIRDIVWFINPFHDKSADLFLRMKELASKMLANLDYTFSSDGNAEQIFDLLPDLNKRRHVFLIFKEILNNIVKHSGSTEANILLSAESEKFILTVSDNGKGFVESEIVPGEGLKNLRNRAEQAGAQISIESNSGIGTKITLEVPL